MELNFTNPITLVIAKSLFGENLKKAAFVMLQDNKNSFRLNSELIAISQIIARQLHIEFSTRTQIEFESSPGEIVELSKYLNQFDNGHKIIMTGSDSYCALGFNNLFKFPLTKLNLTRKWRTIEFKSNDLLYGLNISLHKNHVFKNATLEDFSLVEMKSILNVIAKNLPLFKIGNDVQKNTDYLLAMPHIHNLVGSEFNAEFFRCVKLIAKEKNLAILVKNHPNDKFNYREYLKGSINSVFLDSDEERQIPAEILMQTSNIKFTLSVPSSALLFADLSCLQVYGAKDRHMFRTRFLDQTPFLERLNIKMKLI